MRFAEKSYQKNIACFQAFRFCSNMLIIGPILVPFMLWKGLSYSQIMLLQSIAALAVFLFEVPTGAIADKVSRKFSLTLSGFFCGAGILLYILGQSFAWFALAELCFGIGMTFHSGADSALLYESLKHLQREKQYQHIEGHTASLIFAGQAIGSVLSGFLYKSNPYFPFWISLAFLLGSIIVSFFFMETAHEKSEHAYFVHIIKSVGIALKSPRILWAFLFSALMGFCFRSTFWLYEPYFKTVHIDVQWFGVIFFVFNMIAAFSSKVLVRKYADHRPRKILLVLAAMLALSFLLPALFVFPTALIFLGLQQIVRGLYQPTMRFYINHQIQDQYRATVISLVSLIANLSFALFSPLVGFSLDHWKTIPTYWWMGTVVLGGILVLFQLRRYQKRPVEI